MEEILTGGDTVDITHILVERLKLQGVKTEEVIYSLCNIDIIECIAEVFAEKALDFSGEELRELLDIGVGSTENIDWWNPIQHLLIDQLNKERKYNGNKSINRLQPMEEQTG